MIECVCVRKTYQNGVIYERGDKASFKKCPAHFEKVKAAAEKPTKTVAEEEVAEETVAEEEG